MVAVQLLIILLCLWLSTPAWGQTGNVDTKTQLNTDINTNWADNSSNLISAAIARQTLLNAVSSYQQAARVNAQTGTTYTIVVDDYGKLVTFSNASPVAVTLPQATTTFATFNTYMCNVGAGLVTITPTTSTIGGNATLGLSTNQCMQAVSDGTNYQIFPGPPPAFLETGFTNCTLAASVGSNLLTVALKDNAGNDPSAGSRCQINFRNSTAATGSIVTDTVSAALSINTNAVGATLGSSNSTSFRFWVVAFDNAGTVALALYNASNATTCQAIAEEQVQSSTAMSASATSIGVYYTPNGTTLTSKAIRILGYVEYGAAGLATAGTYASGPGFINVLGTGGKRPCDLLQAFYATNSTATGTSLSAGADTNLSQAITLRFATSLVYVSAFGNITSAAQTDCVSTLRNTTGSVNIGNLAKMLISIGAITPAAMTAIQKPNSLSAQTYKVRIISTDNTNTCTWNNDADPQTMVVWEIMG
jgi:hypothetical protein